MTINRHRYHLRLGDPDANETVRTYCGKLVNYQSAVKSAENAECPDCLRAFAPRPPVSVDLRFDLETATAELANARVQALLDVERKYDDLANRLAAAHDVATEQTELGDWQRADAALLVNFDSPVGFSGIRIETQNGDAPRPWVPVAPSVQPGEYRALILIHRRDDGSTP